LFLERTVMASFNFRHWKAHARLNVVLATRGYHALGEVEPDVIGSAPVSSASPPRALCSVRFDARR